VANKILFAPTMPAPIMNLVREMTPPGFELEVADHGTPEFYEKAREAEFYLGFPRPGMSNEFFRSAPKLKLIQLVSAGYDRLDVQAAQKARVPIANNGGANSVAVSEHAILLILAVLRKLVWEHNNVAAGKWRVGDFSDPRLYEAEGKTLGIIGLGNIGKKVARRAAAFDMKILYYDILRLTEDQEDALGVRFALFTEILKTADIVTLHVPLTDLTRNMIGDRELAMMKPTAVLINTCRGPVVNEDALYKALASGQIMAAGIDVMREEPPVTNHPLFTLPNITLTPHTAGPTWENWTKAFRNGFDNIQRVAAGDKPRWVVPELRDLLG
jgi:phosphoglycerate dehydrogenase-like enzyme